MLRENDRGHKTRERENVQMTDADVWLQVRPYPSLQRGRVLGLFQQKGSAFTDQASDLGCRLGLGGVLESPPMADTAWSPVTEHTQSCVCVCM